MGNVSSNSSICLARAISRSCSLGPAASHPPTHLLGGLTVLRSQAVGRAGHPELALQCVSTKDSAHLISIAGSEIKEP